MFLSKLCSHSRRLSLWLAAFTLVLPMAFDARADMIELTNGDHYRGSVISMTPSNVVFMSEIQGMVKLPRAKIAQITLHDVVPKTVATTNQAADPTASTAATARPQNVGAPLIMSGANTTTFTSTGVTAAPSDALVQQMRQQGVDPKLIDQVKQQILEKASPEAAHQFDQTVTGLMSGNISVKDIRAQAQSSIAQIKAAKAEFGPDVGDALDGYLVVLEKFVQESANDNSVTAPGATTPTPAGK